MVKVFLSRFIIIIAGAKGHWLFIAKGLYFHLNNMLVSFASQGATFLISICGATTTSFRVSF